MSGDEVLEHVRDWNPECWVVMVTAVDPDDSILDMDFDEYLTKPIEKRQLHDVIEQLLLFDRYEELLTEYHTVTRKYACLRSNATGDDRRLERLRERRRELRNRIDATIESFTDDAIAEVFEGIHTKH